MSRRSSARQGRKQSGGKNPAKTAGDVSGERVAERLARLTFHAGLVLGVLVYAPQVFYERFETPKLFVAQLTVLASIGLWGARELFRKQAELRVPRIMLPAGMLFLLGGVSAIWSLNTGFALERLFFLGTMGSFMVISWAVCRGKPKEQDRILYVMIFLSAAVGLWGLLLDWIVPLRHFVYPQFATQGLIRYKGLMSNQGNPNVVMHILVLTAPLALGAFLRELALSRGSALTGRRPWAALLMGIIFHLLMVCIFSSGNRSGLVAFLFSLVIITAWLLYCRRSGLIGFISANWKRMLVALAGAVVVLGMFTILTDTVSRAAEAVQKGITERAGNWRDRFASLRNSENMNVYSRVVFLETGAEMIADDPLLGKGIGQFVIYYPKYKTAKHWDRFSLLPPEIRQWELIPLQAHNEYLQVFIELGLAGLALFLLFWFLLARRVMLGIRALERDPVFYLYLGAAAGIAGVLANSLLTFPFQTVGSGIFMWSACGVLIARCCEAGSGADCLPAGWRVSLGKPLARTVFALAVGATVLGGVYGSVRLLRGQHTFFTAMRDHAQDLGASRQEAGEATRLLPWRFETHYVAGWLAYLAGDQEAAAVHFENSVSRAPWFPPPYLYLGEAYYLRGDIVAAEAALDKYREIYKHELTPRAEFVMGLICLQDSTDRFDEAKKHLREAGGMEPLHMLVRAFMERGSPDSALSVMENIARNVRWDNKLYGKVNYELIRTALAAGDTAVARNVFNNLRRIAPPEQQEYVDSARQLLEETDAQDSP